MPQSKSRKKILPSEPPLVVGIGASAGGSEALQAMFDALPDESNLSFVIILHIDPAAKEVVSEVLSKFTKLPVQEIENGTPLQPGNVYTAPGKQVVSLKGGIFQLAASEKTEDRRNPIDKFFYSLARDQGERSVAIILSGNGSDGSLGMREISKAGGMLLAQAPSTARNTEMPESAIDTGLVDHVLAPANLTEELLAYAQHMQVSGEKEQFEKLRAEVDDYLPVICETLLEVTGHNFRHYKVSTLGRRIQRRIQVLRMSSVKDYATYIRKNETEARLLFNDLLIGVTSFFRDPDAFECLSQEVLPRLLKDRKLDEPLRIWVPGCATGEEAYTLAMLVREHIRDLKNPPEVQIFATDIDEESLSSARQGVYSLAIAEELSPERLKRFFIKKAQHYHVSKEIRGMVLFSVHNLINDPPFSKLDLISCRNLLIYLGSHLQKKLIPLFHYALKPGGYLFLGTSENLSSHRELFRPLNAKHRISQRLPTAVRSTALFTGRGGPPTLVKPPNVATASENDTYLFMQRIVLDEFAPKALVVDEEGQIVCASGNLEKYMTVSAGAFHNNAMRLVRDGLRVGLRTTLAEAVKVRRQIVHSGLALRTRDGMQRVMLIVQPMPHMGDDSGLFMVVFQDVGLPMREEAVLMPASEEASALIEQLERELLTTREDLEHTVQDLEAANEELKSSNEELLSMNEELQSANEELETSKEEVQHANDTLNRVNTDLENLLASTQIATIFLDNEGNVRRVTPSVENLYNLRPADTGRPLAHFTHKIKNMPPLPSIAEIHASGKPIEHEVETGEGIWYIRRLLSYRTNEGIAEGILIMFTEITDRKRSELALQKSEERLRLALGASRLGIFTWYIDEDRAILSPRAAEIFGLGTQVASWSSMREFIHPEDRKRVQESLQHSLESREDYSIEYRLIRKDGSQIWISSTGHGEYDANGHAVSMTRLVQDITARKNAEYSLMKSERLYRAIGESIDYGIWVCEPDGKNIYTSPSLLKLVGITQEQCSDFGWGKALHPEEAAETMAMWKKCVEENWPVWDREHRFRGVDGNWHPVLARGIPVKDEAGKIVSWVGINLDISQIKQAELDLREADRRKDEFLAILAHELRNPLAPLSNGLQIIRMTATTNPGLFAQAQGMMERQVNHMVRLVDDLLDVSRITRGQIELHKEKLDIASVIENAVELSRSVIDSKGHALTVSLPKTPLTVQADPVRLTQIIANLLNNAAKYTHNGGKIELSVKRRGDQVVISVQDNGIGIPAHMLSGIFDMFVQVDTAMERAQGGLGIGLTLVRKLIELHGGSIDVNSAGTGKGSEFILSIPVSE